jgi:hypothetical protein
MVGVDGCGPGEARVSKGEPARTAPKFGEEKACFGPLTTTVPG